MSYTFSRRWSATTLVAFALFAGCNAILDNRDGVLREVEGVDAEAEAEPAPPETRPDGTTPRDWSATPLADADPHAPPTCPANQHVCADKCVAITDPRYGCGNDDCAPCHMPHATSGCEAKKCIVATCDRGYSDCNAKSADGCETDLSKAATCGACDLQCTGGTPLCAASGASFACTSGCPPSAPLRCNAVCVDPLANINACGGCNMKCPAVANATIACVAGMCTFTCAAPLHACANTCVGDADPTACGPACAVCPAPPNAAAACAAGVCGFTCLAGFGNCDAIPANGCEATLATDPLNCGACGKACAAGRTCVKSACVVPPP